MARSVRELRTLRRDGPRTGTKLRKEPRISGAVVGADFDAPTFAGLLALAHTYLVAEHGIVPVGDRGDDPNAFPAEGLARVPVGQGLDLIGYFVRQGYRVLVNIGATSPLNVPGNGVAVAKRLEDVRELWRELRDAGPAGDPPDVADWAALWDSLFEAAVWLDRYGQGTQPEQLTLTATTAGPVRLPIPPIRTPLHTPPRAPRAPGTKGRYGWLVLALAIYLATRSR